MAALDMFGNSNDAELSIKERQRCAAIVKSVKEYSLRQIAEKSYTSLVKQAIISLINPPKMKSFIINERSNRDDISTSALEVMAIDAETIRTNDARIKDLEGKQ